MFRLVSLIAVLSATAALASAGLLTNGNFEDPASQFDVLSFYSTDLPGWTVLGGDVETVHAGVFGSQIAALDGQRFLDLDGVHAGTLTQSFATTPGEGYILNFGYANNPFNGPNSTASAEVSVTGTASLADFTITHSTTTPQDADWTMVSVSFTADSTSTTLQFRSLDAVNSDAGIFLDAVDVGNGAPEPVSLTLLAAGLAAFGLARRRKAA